MSIVPRRLERLFGEILREARANPDFARRLDDALGGLSQGLETKGEGSLRGKRRHRRAPGVIDPFQVYQDGEGALRERLGDLDVERLKDIVAEHAMDSAKLAMKWKTRERLIDLIVETVTTRSRKGDAFRATERSEGSQ